jgi:hypothetical protein
MPAQALPDYLTHYYDAARGPLRSLTELPPGDAEALLESIRARGKAFASRRAPEYLGIRFELEARIREIFISKGGAPLRLHPHYFILGSCDWCLTWYERPLLIRVPVASLPAGAVSFTYGDSFPAMRYPDGKPYRGQVYTLAELPGLVERYGLPQDWNPDGKLAPERYIEAQVWDDIGCFRGNSLPKTP